MNGERGRTFIGATCLATLLAAPLAAQVPSAPWLEGCWAAGTMQESWVRRDNGRLLGVGSVVRDGQRRVTERLRLVPREDRVLYIAEPVGQRATTFPATTAGPDSLVVTNPTHDFPQRIAYVRAPRGALTVHLAGMEAGVPRTMRLDFLPRPDCAALGEVGIGLVPDGTTIRVRTADASVTGMILALGATTVTLRHDTRTQEIPLAAILGVERQRRSAGRGALIGGGIGGLAVGGFFYLIVGGLCESTHGCQGDQWAGGALGALVGGAGGALVGAGVGRLVPRWERLVP